MTIVKEWMGRLRGWLAAIRLSRADLILAGGAAILGLSLLLVVALPAYHRLEDRARLAAVKGVAATLQLAAESYASQNLGRYPTDPLDLIPYLPGDRAPLNPLTGEFIDFRAQPGDVTYDSADEGRGYEITAWIYGPGRQARALLTLTNHGG